MALGDGSKEWTAEWIQKLNHKFGDDGSFWILYEDLLKKYQVFDRTRLFSDQWKATQSWAALNVPWTVDYHDTKFSFTLEKKAQVVLVLSQVSTSLNHLIETFLNNIYSLILVTSVVSKVNTTLNYPSVFTKLARKIISFAVMEIIGPVDLSQPSSNSSLESITFYLRSSPQKILIDCL